MKRSLLFLLIFASLLTSAQNLTQSLTACYSLDGNANDPINNLNGILSSVTATVDRFNTANSAYHFTGSSSSYIQLPNSSLLKPTNALSCSMWIRFDDMNSHHYILYTSNGCSSYFEGYALTVESRPGGYKFALAKADNSCSAGGQAILFGNTSLSALTWYHIAFYAGNDSLKMFLNGIQDGQMTVNNTFAYNNTANVYLGGTLNSSWNYPVRGTLDNVKFYNRKLSNTEFGLLYSIDPPCAVTTTTVPPMPILVASFTAPDTICANTSFQVQNTSTGTISSYYWSACGSTVAPAYSTSGYTLTQGSAPLFLSINQDASNNYIFATQDLSRLNYGSSLFNVPTTTVVANLPGSEGIWIEKEGSTWYGLVVGGTSSSYLSQLNFGSSLANTPTVTNLGNIGSLNFPHRLQVFRTGGNAYCFTVNRNSSTLVRFDFGNSISNTPIAVNMGNIGSLNGPVDFSILNDGTNWYAFVANNGDNTISRLDFGTSLLNTPTGTNLGGFPGFSGPRGINVWTECNSLKGYLLSDISNQLYSLSFPTGVTGTITATNLNLGAAAGFNFPYSIKRYRLGDEIALFIPNANNSSITRVDCPTCTVVPSSTLQTPPAMTFTAPGTYTISLICNEEQVDQSSYCKVITVIGSTLMATSSPTALCAGSGATLTATGANSYTWQPGSQSGNSITVSPSVTTVYTVSGTNNSGCTASTNLTLTVSSGLQLQASASPSMVCPGSSSTLTASGANTYIWMPGNLTGSNIVVSPTVASIYTVTGSNGVCTNTALVNLNVGLQTQIISSGDLCNNSTSNLYASPAGTLYSYSWNGPGIIGSSTNSNISVNAGGVYTVTVTDTLNGCSGTSTVLVLSSAIPIPMNITPSSTVTCFPGPAVNILVTAAANLSWQPAADVSPNTGPLVSVSPSITSTYSVFATLGSCSGSAAITISVNSTPTVLNTGGNPTICAGTVATLSASGAENYTWLPDNIAGASVTVSPLSTANYTLTGFNGNCSASFTTTVTVLPSPLLVTSVLPDTICTGNTSILSVSGAPTILWLSPGLPASSAVAVSPTVTSTYTASGTNSLGCTTIAVLTVEVINSPAISAISSSSVICLGETVTLTVINGEGTYTWMPGGQVGTNISGAPASSTTYTVSNGTSHCGYATVMVIVNHCHTTALGLTNAADEPLDMNGEFYKVRFTVTAINTSIGDLTQVTLNDDLQSTFISPISYTIVNPPLITSKNSLLSVNPQFDGRSELSLVSPASSTLVAGKRDTLVFTVMVDPEGFNGTLKNSVVGFALDQNNIQVGDSSNNGFQWDPDGDGDPTNNNEITPITLAPFELFIPNGFSPDGDGNHDFFVISGLNGRHVKLTVFNRWGNKVYEKNNYDNSWDGTPNAGGLSFGSGKLPEAAYYYVLQFLDGNKETKNGFIVLRY